jgi:hypothetical protein
MPALVAGIPIRPAERLFDRGRRDKAGDDVYSFSTCPNSNSTGAM